VKKSIKRKFAPWMREIVALMRRDGFEEPESQDDELARSDVHRRLEFKLGQLQWAPLWNQRAASDAKVVGCYVGREYAMGRWLWTEPSEPIPEAAISALRDGLHHLEVESGPGIAEEMLEMIFAAREKVAADPSLIDYDALTEPYATILKKVLQRPLLEVADFLDGFRLPVLRRAADNDVWANAFITSYVCAVMYNDWPQIEQQRPLARLCDYILDRIPPRLSSGIRKNDQLLTAFRASVRSLCNEVGFSTGHPGRPKTTSRRGA
jgi:hypothetical protein